MNTLLDLLFVFDFCVIIYETPCNFIFYFNLYERKKKKETKKGTSISIQKLFKYLKPQRSSNAVKRFNTEAQV